MPARSVLDSAVGVGTLPGALLQSLVTQQTSAFTNQGVCQVVHTVGRRPDGTAGVVDDGCGTQMIPPTALDSGVEGVLLTWSR
jgi:hypothetical protein